MAKLIIALVILCALIALQTRILHTDFQDLKIRSSIRLQHLERSLHELEQRFSALQHDDLKDCAAALEDSQI